MWLIKIYFTWLIIVIYLPSVWYCYTFFKKELSDMKTYTKGNRILNILLSSVPIASLLTVMTLKFVNYLETLDEEASW